MSARNISSSSDCAWANASLVVLEIESTGDDGVMSDGGSSFEDELCLARL